MADLDEIVDLGSRADACAAEARPIDAGVGADLDMAVEHGVAQVRDLDQAAAIRGWAIAEAVGTDDHAGVDDAVI
ncbi:MAG: hypothetical protein ACK48N_06715, partial [Planctomyces sp.]